MANIRKYKNQQEYEDAMRKKRNVWNRENYKRLTISVRPEFSERLDALSRTTGIPKRQIVISGTEKYLEELQKTLDKY